MMRGVSLQAHARFVMEIGPNPRVGGLAIISTTIDVIHCITLHKNAFSILRRLKV